MRPKDGGETAKQRTIRKFMEARAAEAGPEGDYSKSVDRWRGAGGVVGSGGLQRPRPNNTVPERLGNYTTRMRFPGEGTTRPAPYDGMYQWDDALFSLSPKEYKTWRKTMTNVFDPFQNNGLA